MTTLLQDLRYGLRVLGKSKGFTAVAVLTLALGVGANAAVFSLIDKLLWRSLPVGEPGRLVLLSAESVSPKFLNTVFSYPDFADYRDMNRTLSGLVAFRGAEATLGVGEEAERVRGELVSGNYFDVLGVAAERGRTFLPEEDAAPGRNPVAVLSHGLWRSRFGADPGVVGKTVTLGGGSYTVVGVAPAGFGGLMLERPAQFWVPLAMQQQLTAEPTFALDKRRAAWLRLAGRLRPGVTLEQAREDLDALARRVREANTPESDRGLPFYERRVLLEPGGRGISLMRKDLSQPLTLLLATVGLILLIACANVANLLLARAASRRREIAVRLALGASRARLVRQLLTESVLLSLVGGATGLLFAQWLAGLLLTYNPYKIDLTQTAFAAVLDARVLGFSLLVSTLSGVAFGLIPAWQSSRPELIPALKGETSALARTAHALGPRGLLVVLQVALSLVVLVGAGLLVRSLRNLFAIDPGFRPAGVLLVPVSLPPKSYDEARAREFFRGLTERLRQVPGAEAVSAATVTPMGGVTYTRSVTVEGHTPEPGQNVGIDSNEVGPGYHDLMGIPIVRGRGFTEGDRVGAPRAAVVNEAFARAYFPGQNPLGKRLWVEKGGTPLEVVGVARDSKYHSLTEAPLPHFDTPLLQDPSAHTNAVVLVRAAGDPARLLPAVRREVKALDPTLALTGAGTLEEELGDSLAAARMAAALTSLFGLVALLLSAVGLYGALSYTVAQRTREFGIRMALGARPADVLAPVMRRGLLLTAAGAAAGLAAALALTRLMSSLLYGVSATDPATFAAIALLLAAVALAASYLPARRATKVDPMVALRYE